MFIFIYIYIHIIVKTPFSSNKQTEETMPDEKCLLILQLVLESLVLVELYNKHDIPNSSTN